MYSKIEASKIRQQFWITFGNYMKPILSAEGLPINWVNYKTGVKNVLFKMDSEQFKTTISINILHQDEEIRVLFYEQFKSLSLLFKNSIAEEWQWQQNINDEYDNPTVQISKSISGVSIFKQQDWPEIISFLKPRIIALDCFWVDVKPIFSHLSFLIVATLFFT